MWALNGQLFPKLQIITVGELLAGKKPDMPTEYGTFAQAPRIEDTGHQLTFG
ncbi:MAG: hypothetical protein H0V96_10490 [Acidimicrobiia bacterium]|nr:hypothetical protein [Acidimicrobiia bacterium]